MENLLIGLYLIPLLGCWSLAVYLVIEQELDQYDLVWSFFALGTLSFMPGINWFLLIIAGTMIYVRRSNAHG